MRHGFRRMYHHLELFTWQFPRRGVEPRHWQILVDSISRTIFWYSTDCYICIHPNCCYNLRLVNGYHICVYHSMWSLNCVTRNHIHIIIVNYINLSVPQTCLTLCWPLLADLMFRLFTHHDKPNHWSVYLRKQLL